MIDTWDVSNGKLASVRSMIDWGFSVVTIVNQGITYAT